MAVFQLVLYTRKGCCLCEGLRQKLIPLKLSQLNPSLELCVVDIDEVDTPSEIKALYDLEVPVLVLVDKATNKLKQLPRVSPRLKGDGLLSWLKKRI